MTYAAKVIADSIASSVRLTTLEVTFPRFILAEFNTHRMFSRNSASSRAIPVERRIQQVRDNPFVPEAFGKNKPGMQAAETLDERDGSKARDAWLRARDAAVEQADRLVDFGVHKQHANRLLEPFCWHTVVVTATEWENFFALRCHPAAQPEMQITAKLMRDAMAQSTPRELQAGAWHMPYVTSEDVGMIYDWSHAVGDASPERLALAMSVARCAAISFERQYALKEIAEYAKRHDSLLAAAHMSPFEHQAQVSWDLDVCPTCMAHGTSDTDAAERGTFIGNFRTPWLQYRKTIAGERVFGSKS